MLYTYWVRPCARQTQAQQLWQKAGMTEWHMPRASLQVKLSRPWHSQGGMLHAMLYTFWVRLTACFRSITHPWCEVQRKALSQWSDRYE